MKNDILHIAYMFQWGDKDWTWVWVDNHGKARRGEKQPGNLDKGIIIDESYARCIFPREFFLKKREKHTMDDYPWNLKY